MKAIRPWLLRFLGFSLVESVTTPILYLHYDNFRLQPITFYINKIYMESHKAALYFVGQDCRGFSRTTLEGRLVVMCRKNLGLH